MTTNLTTTEGVLAWAGCGCCGMTDNYDAEGKAKEPTRATTAAQLARGQRMLAAFHGVWDLWLDRQTLDLATPEQLFELLRAAMDENETPSAAPECDCARHDAECRGMKAQECICGAWP